MSNTVNLVLPRVMVAVAFGAAAACSTVPDPAGFDAYGYLSPSPSADGEFIGNFPSQSECEAAGESWMSQQVVGNPVRVDCFSVDRR